MNGQIWDQTFTLVYDLNNVENAVKEEQNGDEEESTKSAHLVEQVKKLIN